MAERGWGEANVIVVADDDARDTLAWRGGALLLGGSTPESEGGRFHDGAEIINDGQVGFIDSVVGELQ